MKQLENIRYYFGSAQNSQQMRSSDDALALSEDPRLASELRDAISTQVEAQSGFRREGMCDWVLTVMLGPNPEPG